MDTTMIWLSIGAAIASAVVWPRGTYAGQTRVSEFGKYRRYSDATYDGSTRISDDLALGSGTRLAYDLILPTRKGVSAIRPLPVLFKYTPYLRTFTIFDKSAKNIIADLVGLGWKERARFSSPTRLHR